jgi:sugar lactone lactonase YvrE
MVASVFGFTQGLVQGADVTVSNANDSGSGSLREAITNVPVGGSIDFSVGLIGQTISLTSEILIGKAMTIDASNLAGGVTVGGNGSTRFFRVSATGNLTLRGLKLNGGRGNGASENGFGGGLYNDGTVTLERCVFQDNEASNYGGGIHNALNANLTIRRSTFKMGEAGLFGGAISNSSLLTIDGCTFEGNYSGFEGGGIYSDFSSTITITNSTFKGNSAFFYGGAIFNGSPRLSMESSTLVGNEAVRIGGGIYNDFFGTPSSTIGNSIVAQNVSPEGENIFGPWTGSNNITSGDPKLTPLGNFGGPTQTMPPLPDSPAIDAGGATALLTDQRGQPRVLRAAVDIGAFESPLSDYNPTGVTIYSRVTPPDEDGVFEISTDPDFLPVVSTYAGTGTAGFADDARLSAVLGYPSGVAQDSLGNTFFADTGNHRIRMIGADGLVVTIAGTGVYGRANGPGTSAQFAFPSSLAVGPDDNVYVADTYNHRICKLTRPAVPGGSWTVVNLAGTGIAGFVEGAGSVARFNFPYGVTLDTSGNVYVADSINHRIRKISSIGQVSTYAGSGTKGYLDHATASAARFDTPQGLVIADGSLYVADTFNDRIRKITVVGVNAGDVSTFAGSTTGFSDGAGVAAQFDTPSGIATDGLGALYIADEQNHKIRKIDSLGGVTTVAGTGVSGLVNGKSDVARFSAPTGVMVGLDGNLIVADAENHVLRRVAIKPLSVPSTPFTDSYGVQVKHVLDVNALGLDPGVTYYFRWKSTTTSITQLLGQSFYLYDFPVVETMAASNLSPSSAVLNAMVDPKNSRTVVTFEYSTDPGLLKPYEVSTLAGSGVAGYAEGAAALARFSNPSGVVANAGGDIFVADRLNNRIRKITAGGMVSTFAGSGAPGFADGNGTAATFEKPTGLAIDASGNLYVADESNHRIRMITPAGEVSTFAGSGVAGFLDGTVGTARFLYPSDVAVDAIGNVYVADAGNQRIRQIAAGSGLVSTLAGTGVAGSTDGPAESAQFSSPQGLAVDGAGSVFVADTGNHSIRVISAGNVSTLAGSGVEGFLDGPGGTAMFASPRDVAVDANGAAIVTDSGNHRIRRISAEGLVSTLAGSGNAGLLDSPESGLYPVTACQFDMPQGIALDSTGAMLVSQEGAIRRIARSATLPVLTVTPDAEGSGERLLFALVDRPLLYGATYYFQARGTSYRDSVTGGILSFVTPRAMISVFDGINSSAPELSHLQTDVVDFGNTPTGQSFTRQFTISNPGTWPLTVSTVNLPPGFTLTGGVGVINPLESATFQITLTAAVAGDYAGNVVVSSNAPEKTIFSFPIAGVVLDPPVLTTLDPTALGEGIATFNATVNPRESSTTVWFEWSQDPEFDGVNVTTLAGSTSGYEEGTGTAAKFNQPSGMVTDASGNTYVADKQNHRIRKIASDGSTSTFAGTGVAGFADGAGVSAQFDQPVGLALNAAGVLFVTDSNNHRIRAITSAGVVSTYSGLGTTGFTDGIPSAARFNGPSGLAIDSTGVLYVADSNNHRIRKIATDGSVSTLAGSGAPGTANGFGTAAQFDTPIGIARDATGSLYVTESNSHAVRRITADGTTSNFAGSAAISGFANASGNAARFSQPTGLGVGVNGLLYVADTGNHRIRSINAAGLVATVAGSGASGTVDGFGDVAEFFSPISIGTTASGGVIVGESGGSALREITSLQILVQAATGLNGTNDVPVELSVTGLPIPAIYYYRAIASNGGGTTIGNVISLVPANGSPFEIWQIASFGSDAGNPAISGASACPAGDGVPNLLKYAFGKNPYNNTPRCSMPAMSLDAGSLGLTYTKVLAATDLDYIVEWSTDLLVWRSDGVTEQTLDGDAATREILATVPAAPPGAKFIRMNITLK